MIELDIRWLYVLIGLTAVLLGFLLFIVRNSSPQVPGPFEWASGSLLKGMGLLYFAMHPWPGEFLNILLTNLMLVTSNSLFLKGIWKFKNKKSNRGMLFILPIFTILVNIFFILIWNNVPIRIACNSFLFALSSFLIVYELLSPPRRVYRNVFLINAFSFLLFALVLISRGLLSKNLSNSGVMDSNIISVMVLLFGTILQGVSAFGFIIMVNIWVAEDLKMQVSLKDKFLSIIAHDLKNQIGVIGGFSELLHKSITRENHEKTIQFSGYIRQASIEVNALLTNLLDWARVKTKADMFHPEKLVLSRIISEEIDLNNSIAHNKDITVDFQNTSGDLEIMGDKNMLKTVLRNLIINAIKFTNKGGKITIRADVADNFAKVSVCDSGIGIRQEDLNKIFSPNGTFLSTEGTESESGSGLGLMLCREFVDKHGGRIWAESVFEKGSTFYFVLPLNRNNAKTY